SPIVAPGGNTAFSVTFTPSGTGTRNAAIHITNNDGNENPFDIALTGNGACPTSFTVNDNGDAGDLTPGDGICATGTAVCTLRAAIQEANANSISCGAIDIGFSIPSSIITVTSELQLNHNININGPTTASIVVAGVPASPTRIFNTMPGRTVSLSYLTVTGGMAAFGGGLLAQGPSSNTTLTGMLFAGNTAVDGSGVGGGGGAATINGGRLTIINSTFSGNTGTNGGGLLILGGGPLDLINATVTNNNADGNTGVGSCSVDGDGGGIGGPTMPGSGISLRNSIVAGNQDCNSNNPNITLAGSFNNLGNNLTSGNPLLSPLANNGGPTFTHALMGISPAIDAGNNCVFDNTCIPAVGVALTADQRGPGFSRKVNGNPNPDIVVDIGAYERQTPSASSSTIAGRIVDSDGNAVEGAAVRMGGTQNRLAVTDREGNYHFDEVENGGFYTVTPSRLNFTFSPAERTFSQLGQHTDAVFTASASDLGANPLDASEYFVRQQYLDFLGREPDEAGLSFWVNNIDSCGADSNCLAAKRDDTSAAFFLSIEFRQTGYFVHRMYQSAYGDRPGSPVPLLLAEFRPDTRAIGRGVVVNEFGWQAKLEANKEAFALDFVSRARFASAYPTTMTPASFVDKLFQTAGITPEDAERAAAIHEFGGGADTANAAARARALRRVAENETLQRQEFNQAFVLMQYLGYMGRDPNSEPDTDFAGYNFWLNKLNSFDGDFRRAEMVKAFLVAGEYRARFPR
ncbi:MAG TPA: choice-of-anchor Q domain-containing protein, partial [Pyrinomonadaceae bacterium]